MKMWKKALNIMAILFVVIGFTACKNTSGGTEGVKEMEANGVKTTTAQAYKKDVTAEKAESIMIRFQEGGVEHNSQKYEAGCHILSVEQGEVIKMDVKQLIMRQPGTECAELPTE